MQNPLYPIWYKYPGTMAAVSASHFHCSMTVGKKPISGSNNSRDSFHLSRRLQTSESFESRHWKGCHSDESPLYLQPPTNSQDSNSERPASWLFSCSEEEVWGCPPFFADQIPRIDIYFEQIFLGATQFCLPHLADLHLLLFLTSFYHIKSLS